MTDAASACLQSEMHAAIVHRSNKKTRESCHIIVLRSSGTLTGGRKAFVGPALAHLSKEDPVHTAVRLEPLRYTVSRLYKEKISVAVSYSCDPKPAIQVSCKIRDRSDNSWLPSNSALLRLK